MVFGIPLRARAPSSISRLPSNRAAKINGRSNKYLILFDCQQKYGDGTLRIRDVDAIRRRLFGGVCTSSVPVCRRFVLGRRRVIGRISWIHFVEKKFPVLDANACAGKWSLWGRLAPRFANRVFCCYLAFRYFVRIAASMGRISTCVAKSGLPGSSDALGG